jgi:hypothetical protein
MQGKSTVSNNLLIFIPTDPQYVPSVEAQQQACTYLEAVVPGADEVSAYEPPDVEFVATGGNWQGVFCPSCGMDLQMSWWVNAMDKASETGFDDLAVCLPCCGWAGSLNDLHYSEPTGFTRFLLVAQNPCTNVANDVDLALEQILGCPLKRIWSHI